jgi:hypothetical protein
MGGIFLPKELFFLQRIRSCLGYQLVFCFGDFITAASMYVVDMIAYYYGYISQH